MMQLLLNNKFEKNVEEVAHGLMRDILLTVSWRD
jgi:hypothetical protein